VKVVVAEPLMACAPVPLNVTVFAPGVNVPPLFVQSPATEMFPPAVTVTPELTWTLPNVIAVVGVIVPVAAKIVVAPVRLNVPRVLVTLLLNVIEAAPEDVNDELLPFCVNVPPNDIVPVETVIAQPLAVATAAPANIVPPTVSVPVSTVNVISEVTVVGCTVMLPVQLSVPPLKVIDMLAPFAVVLRLALAHCSVLLEERMMLWVMVAAFARAPLMVRFSLSVSVDGLELPKESDAMDVATDNVGWLAPVKLASPMVTAVPAPGTPAVQLVPTFQSELVVPVHDV